MPCVLLCSSCNAPVVATDATASRCPVCGSNFSPRLREAIQRAAHVKRPFLISLGMYYLFFFCALTVFSLAEGFARGSGIFGLGILGMSHTEFLFWLLLPSVLSTLILAWIAWGFWKQRPWSRHLVMLFWCLPIPFLVFVPREVLAVGTILIMTGILGAGWYFYRKPNVVAYYSELKRRGPLMSTVMP